MQLALHPNLNCFENNNQAPQTLPFLSVNLPMQTIMKSTSQPIPKTPPVRSQITPVPIFPDRKRCTPKTPRNKVIKIAGNFAMINSPFLACEIFEMNHFNVIILSY